jgi:hypothetical protein
MLLLGEPLACLLVPSLIEFMYGWMEFGTESNVGVLEDGDLRYHEDRSGDSLTVVGLPRHAGILATFYFIIYLSLDEISIHIRWIFDQGCPHSV